MARNQEQFIGGIRLIGRAWGDSFFLARLASALQQQQDSSSAIASISGAARQLQSNLGASHDRAIFAKERAYGKMPSVYGGGKLSPHLPPAANPQEPGSLVSSMFALLRYMRADILKAQAADAGLRRVTLGVTNDIDSLMNMLRGLKYRKSITPAVQRHFIMMRELERKRRNANRKRVSMKIAANLPDGNPFKSIDVTPEEDAKIKSAIKALSMGTLAQVATLLNDPIAGMRVAISLVMARRTLSDSISADVGDIEHWLRRVIGAAQKTQMALRNGNIQQASAITESSGSGWMSLASAAIRSDRLAKQDNLSEEQRRKFATVADVLRRSLFRMDTVRTMIRRLSQAKSARPANLPDALPDGKAISRPEGLPERKTASPQSFRAIGQLQDKVIGDIKRIRAAVDAALRDNLAAREYRGPVSSITAQLASAHQYANYALAAAMSLSLDPARLAGGPQTLDGYAHHATQEIIRAKWNFNQSASLWPIGLLRDMEMLFQRQLAIGRMTERLKKL